MKVGSITELKKKNEDPIPGPIIMYPRKRTRSSDYQQHLKPHESKTRALKVDPPLNSKMRLSSSLNLQTLKVNPPQNEKMRLSSSQTTNMNMFLASVIKDNSIVLQNPYRDRSATAPSTINLDLEEKEQQQREFSVMQLKTSIGSRGNNVDPRMHAFQQKKQKPALIGKKRKRIRPSSNVSLVFWFLIVLQLRSQVIFFTFWNRDSTVNFSDFFESSGNEGDCFVDYIVYRNIAAENIVQYYQNGWRFIRLKGVPNGRPLVVPNELFFGMISIGRTCVHWDNRLYNCDCENRLSNRSTGWSPAKNIWIRERENPITCRAKLFEKLYSFKMQKNLKKRILGYW